ncbi:MAG TPA: BMP family ABC transporter substrate-binding protein, partial [Promineifilum sp.]|nr:BMP family ABC transporter substrate-binding protein [Promineifilum sp.]
MKRYLWLVLMLALALALVACGGAQTPPAEEGATEETAPAEEEAATEEEAPAEEATGPFRAAVVMPSAINDLAFSQSMYDTLVAIQNEMGAENFEFAYSENMFVVDDAATALRDYASQGYNLVIAHGSQYGSSLQEIAPDFPETSFAWGTTVDTFGIPNIYAYEARSEEGGYVNGVIAASLSESGVLGVIGPIETGDARLYVDGFVAGAKATNPDIKILTAQIGPAG